jgi:protein tyrosine phosphatase (PTP) superfamily phosphohydrolase (DUF442 family)
VHDSTCSRTSTNKRLHPLPAHCRSAARSASLYVSLGREGSQELASTALQQELQFALLNLPAAMHLKC